MPIALVTGATGIAGAAIARHLAHTDWRVIALSRRALPYAHPNITSLHADLTDPAAVRAALAPYPITHLFHAAFAPLRKPHTNSTYQGLRRMLRLMKPFVPFIEAVGPLRNGFYTQIANTAAAYDPQKTNLRLLRNAVDALPTLQHVGLVTGGKVYGMHLSPYLHRRWQTPFQEDGPRAPGPNFYYDQEDYLRGEVAARGVTWTIVRPAYLIGENPQAAFNTLIALGVYAALLRANGLPLIFPADPAAADCLYQFSDAGLVARLLAWAAQTPAAHNQALNAVNGPAVRWRDLWPSIAANLSMVGEIRAAGFSARALLGANAGTWDRLVRDHGLQPYRLPDLVPSDFFDLAMVQDWDTPFSLEKVRGLGFTETVDNAEMFSRAFHRLREAKIIP